MTSNLIMALATLALAGCAPATGLDNAGAASGEQLALKATTALSLAELAYNSGETAATAAVRSGALTSAHRVAPVLPGAPTNRPVGVLRPGRCAADWSTGR